MAVANSANATVWAAQWSVESRVGVFFAAFGFALLTTPLVIAALRRLRLMDVPNERSSHTKATIRGAGWGVLFGVLAGWFSSAVGGPGLWWLPTSAVCYGLIGFVDDLRTLPASIRFGAQLVVSSSALVIAQTSGVVDLPLLVLPCGVVFVVGYVNAFNFMDGVNGISGMQAATAGGILAFAGADVGSYEVQVSGIAIAAAALGFLPFNAVRARCFLGDVGSYFIGAWIALVAVLAYDRGVSLITVVSAVAIYAADTGFTLVRRMMKGEQWWTPHRSHVYQRLIQLRFSHLASATVVTVYSVAAGGIGVAVCQSSASTKLVGAAGLLGLASMYLALPRAFAPHTPTSRH